MSPSNTGQQEQRRGAARGSHGRLPGGGNTAGRGREVSHKAKRMSKGTNRHCHGRFRPPPPPAAVTIVIVTRDCRHPRGKCHLTTLPNEPLVPGCGLDLFWSRCILPSLEKPENPPLSKTWILSQCDKISDKFLLKKPGQAHLSQTSIGKKMGIRGYIWPPPASHGSQGTRAPQKRSHRLRQEAGPSGQETGSYF